MLAFALGLRTPLDTLALSFYVLTSLTRLARFNVTVAMLPKDKTGKSKYFEGTPVPFACFVCCAFMASWVWMGRVGANIPLGVLGAQEGLGKGTEWLGGWGVHPVIGVFVVNGCLMVSKTLKVPKP